jgi:hypothetical protein
MQQSWLELVESVLRPSRPHLSRCELGREPCLAARKLLGEARTKRLAMCEARIESARAAVFMADDGVVSARMTDLEREWRALARPEPDAGLMDLWASIAPPSWIDRKRWRASAPGDRLDAAIVLASDPEGIEAAEAAARSLRAALRPWGGAVGMRIHWRFFEEDAECVAALLAEPLRAALEAISARDSGAVVLERGRRVEREVLAAASARHPEHAGLARDVAHAAFVEHVWRAASLPDHLPDPVAPLRALWKTGYVLASVTDVDVELRLPR